MTDTGTKPNAKAPTAKELRKGPVVKLHRPGWGNSAWAPPGFLYPSRFTDDHATVLKSHYDLWIGDTNAIVNGIDVTVPEKKKTPKPQSTK